ncbi:MAG: hypothetical protein A2934_04410 [Candidatus Sungbacteria bacterium RIFCSPLOWO2_01_FULL_47_10]|uniref:Uncharacterized protein n=1 Tax=Candidatus Sungbacteria bacterium RIFCSPLOWO2_01_FULL_47_10 TaxID=1802276 RepID=A0A1G2L296_9BACT|nr:MAG: hypothetical protein A2934_04410 [Candidatus Sungbacteria bacterium RIFCSPLOWO2_01_FULL_47_10]
MKRNLIIGILLILVLVFAWIAFSPSAPKTSSATKSHFAQKLSASGSITCTYPQVLHTSYQSGEITHELPKPETNPIIMTFSDFDSEVAKVKFIDATQSISEVPLIKVIDTAEKLMFLEGNGEPYMTVHTIYKESGVATYEKSMSLLGIPVGSMGMGSCVDY